MKKRFIAKGQTRFNILTRLCLKDNTVVQRIKAFKLPVGHEIVIRNVSGKTEEGYSSVSEVWDNRGGVLYREMNSNSSDCDGRYSSHKEQVLRDGSWHTVNDGQRDHAAEAAGY